MKNLVSLVFLISIVAGGSCDRKPFVEYKFNYNKEADGCENLSPSFRMISNIGGERYEFSKCLPAPFDAGSLDVKRAGDTVLVNFPAAPPAAKMATYMITLDIDSYPRYHYITIDEETYLIGYSDK